MRCVRGDPPSRATACHNWVRKTFFPGGVFAIGAGKQRWEVLTNRRRPFNPWALAIAIGLLVAGLVLGKILR